MAYNPNQPRAPKGSDIGGQWIKDPWAYEDVWYDRYEKTWVVQRKDTEGNQVGTLDYQYTKREALAWAKYLASEREAGARAMHEEARRAATAARAELAKDREAGKNLDYQTIDMMDETGYWGKDREILHQQIEDRFFVGKHPVRNPETYIMGGGPAAGKSTVLQSGGVVIPENTVSVDTDYIKTMIPEYERELALDNPAASLVVHEESSYLAKRISFRAVKEGYNVVKDGTGDNSIEHLQAQILALGGGDRPVHGVYVTIPIEEAIRRSDLRGEQTGRFVPHKVMIDTHRGVSRVFPEAVKKNAFTTVKLFDNSFSPPVLVAEKRDGEVFRVINEDLYAAFLAKVNFGK